MDFLFFYVSLQFFLIKINIDRTIL